MNGLLEEAGLLFGGAPNYGSDSSGSGSSSLRERERERGPTSNYILTIAHIELLPFNSTKIKKRKTSPEAFIHYAPL